MTRHPLQATVAQQALALGLAALITTAVLGGLLGLAGPDAAQLLAQQALRAAPQAANTLPVLPDA